VKKSKRSPQERIRIAIARSKGITPESPPRGPDEEPLAPEYDPSLDRPDAQTASIETAWKALGDVIPTEPTAFEVQQIKPRHPVTDLARIAGLDVSRLRENLESSPRNYYRCHHCEDAGWVLETTSMGIVESKRCQCLIEKIEEHRRKHGRGAQLPAEVDQELDAALDDIPI
jgi:hypothetical protein